MCFNNPVVDWLTVNPSLSITIDNNASFIVINIHLAHVSTTRNSPLRITKPPRSLVYCGFLARSWNGIPSIQNNEEGNENHKW